MGWKDAPEVSAAWADAPLVDEPRKNVDIRGEGYDAAMNYTGKNARAGAARGFGSIGATLLTPVDMAMGNTESIGNPERRKAMDDGAQAMGGDPASPEFQTNKLLAEMLGTSGVGSFLAKGVQMIPGAAKALPHLIESLRTGGMATNGATGVYGTGVRVAGGAVNGAATAGLINPEAAQEGALIGATMAPAVQVAGKAGQYIGEKAADKYAEAVKRYKQRAPLNETIEKAVEAGYVIPPNMVKPSLSNQVIESISGKQATQQIASTRNTEVTEKLVRKSLGIADDVPLSAGTLEDLRKTAGKAYAEVSNLSPQAAADLEALKVARNEAQGWFKAYNRSARPDDLKLAKEARALSDQLETALESHAAAAKRPDLIPALRDARKQIAKTYTVSRALNDASGTVDARVLGRMHEKGLPLSDGLDVAGRFASAFPTIAKSPQQIGSPAAHNLKSMASAIMGTGSGLGGAAIGGAALSAPLAVAGAAVPFVVPAAARSMMFRQGAQRALIPQAPEMSKAAQLAQLLVSPELRQALLRSAPVTASLSQ